MKTKIIIIAMAITLSCQAQDKVEVLSSARLGWQTGWQTPVVSAEADITMYNVHLKPMLSVLYADDCPAYFGAKISYEQAFAPESDWSIEAGYGRLYELWSLDRDAENKDGHINGWVNAAFMSLHYKRFFLEYDYLRSSVVSFGMRVHL
jgi:hypothetical protein